MTLLILRIPILDKISIQNESNIRSKVKALQSSQTESFLSFKIVPSTLESMVEVNLRFDIECLSFAIKTKVKTKPTLNYYKNRFHAAQIFYKSDS